MKDVFGKALLDFFLGNNDEDIITSTSISDNDTLSLSYLFRDYNDMPIIEKKALELSHGRILDVGCGAGSHSVYLKNLGYHIKAIDISEDPENSDVASANTNVLVVIQNHICGQKGAGLA